MTAREGWCCSTCKAALDPGRAYYRCTVSSCNSGRMKLRFCSVECWENHIPTARHRKAGFVEEPAEPATPS
jgi:hypothetical protein